LENQKFIDSSVYQLWLVDELVGKVAGVFATGGGWKRFWSGTDANDARFFGRVRHDRTISNQHQVAKIQGLVSPYARSGGTRMEPDGIAETMLEGGRQYGAPLRVLSLRLRGLDAWETMFRRGNSKLFNL